MPWLSAEALLEEETPLKVFDRRELDGRLAQELRIRGGKLAARNWEIRRRYLDGESVTVLVGEFGISERQVLRICQI